MSRVSTFLLACLLLSLAATQNVTDCGRSKLDHIASGVVRLGVPTASVAQTSYSQSLSDFNLGTYAEVFAAFAIAGFQTSSTQTFYSLVVDNIIFSNGNTQMNFTMNYNNPDGSFQTTWSSVKLSWIAVSTEFQAITLSASGLGNYVWAGSVGMSANFTNGVSGAIIPNSPWSRQTNAMIASPECGYINTSPPAFDTTCFGATDPVFVTHTYIMGFQFDPNSTYSLAASALRNGGTTAKIDVDEALDGLTSFVTKNIDIPGVTPTLTGPRILIDQIGQQLRYIKIGIVITVIQDLAGYPNTNPALFQYSGVYMDYSLYNVAQPIQQSAQIVLTDGANYNYFALFKPRYQIFGLSSFYIAKLPASVTVLNYDLNFDSSDSVLLNTDNVNYMTGVRISADQFAKRQDQICTVNTNVKNEISQKHVQTTPDIVNSQQNIYETSSALNFNYFAAGSGIANAASPLSSKVLFTNILYFQNIVPGKAHRIDFNILFPTPGLLTGQLSYQVQYKLSIEGNILISKIATVQAPFTTITEQLGYVFTSSTPPIQVTIDLPRGVDAAVLASSVDRIVSTELILTEYVQAYDPLTDCCVETCPANSGVSLGNPTLGLPPVCVPCSSGLIYNSATKSCQCQTGYYSVIQANTNQAQCYPCLAPLCQSCNDTSRTTCNDCVSGAAFNNNAICQCLTGFYQNRTVCNSCPVRCSSCSVGTVCIACSDNTTRDANNDCNCIVGYFNAGVAVCQKCPVLCKTCMSATNCTSCHDLSNRTLMNSQCVCKTGFYQVVHPNGTLSCQPCDSTCTACSLLPTQCTNCDASANRILGYDNLGNQVCNCVPGYHPNSNGNCVQSNCVADPFCATCLTVLSSSTCIQCIAATFRTLVLPQQKCECMIGFFDKNGICTPCATGCLNCSSDTTCTSCVVSATNNNNGSCNCPSGFFFTTSPIRHCKKCANYTVTCASLTQALTCTTNFTLVQGLCTCPSGRFINTLGQCMPCVNGCTTCNGTTSCQACSVPLLLQGNICVSRCGPGYYQNGFVCTACSQGCASCIGPNICIICLSGRLSYNGFCYDNCPAGSVISNSSTCVDCNSPCSTCTEHPSKCTTCKSCCGNLFNFQCLESCPVGTYSINGTCQYCAYSCQTCVGSNTTCTSCPQGKILYNGGCFDKCPFIMIGGICTFNCAHGLYKTAMNQCQNCDVQCATCVNHPKNCTTCKANFGSAMNGVCLRNCPSNYLSLDGLCKQCNPECQGCTGTCANCIECASGFFKCGSTCCKVCPPNQFTDRSNNRCVLCSGKCKTCSSQSFCTTCSNPQAVPVNGVCNDCSYPCNTCGTAPSQCTTCVEGFSLIGITCIASCPTGAFPKNGVCVCNVGYLYSNQCVAKCPVGYGNVAGQCEKCHDNCASCDGFPAMCSACKNGFALDQVSGVCQKAPSCQFGQYYSTSSNACTRICPSNTYFYENVCLTACLSGFHDNGVGGCIASSPETGCSYPYFLSNGVCVSNCPSGTYPDTQNRVCKSCSSNCFSCLTNTFCYACNAGYDLNKGVCIAATLTCPVGQFRYNGVCYSSCPQGTCEQGSFCQRTCPAGTWDYNGGCYRNCPTKYTTTDACVDNCPQGTSLVNGVCQVGSQACPAGQYWDGNSASCRNCQFPCAECSLTASFCTVCSGGLTLNQNMCVSSSNTCGSGRFSEAGQCRACPQKCQECISASVCSVCANGYNFNGNDCVKTLAQLKQLKLTIKSVTKRGNTAFITIKPSIIPNGLSPQQQNNFFTVVPAAADKDNIAFVNQWLSTVEAGSVTVAVNYNRLPLKSAVFIAINGQLLTSSYSSIGYNADASSFVSAAVNINLPATPNNVIPPSNAIKSPAGEGLSAVAYNAAKKAEKDVLA